mgnify:CR=1 FL=1
MPITCVIIYAGVGFSLIVYMAALQNVPQELYEAATIDGANGFVQFFKITFSLDFTYYLLSVYCQIDCGLQNIYRHQCNGYGRYSSEPGFRSLQQRVVSYDFGYASAESWVLVAIIFDCDTSAVLGGRKKWVHY